MTRLLSQLFRARMQQVYRTGILQMSEKEEARRIRVVNVVSLATGILVAIYGIAFYMLLRSMLILIPAVFFFCPAFFAMIWLNGKQRHMFSRIGAYVLYILVILYYGAILGRVTEVQLLAVFMMSIALLIWRPQEKVQRFVCVLMPIICLVILEFIYYFHLVEPLPLSQTTQNLYRWMVMPVVLFLNYLAISLYQDNIMDLLRALRSRNTSLSSSRREIERQRRELEKYNKELEQLVRERTFALVKANTAKTQFISELSHEIRTPLNTLAGLSELLSDEMSRLNTATGAQARQMAKSMNAVSHNIMELINSVLELSKIEAGTTEELRPEPFSLKEWLTHTVSIYQSIASKESILIHLEIDSRFPEMILCDKMMLGQVVNNILSNSLKFSSTGKNIRVRCFHKQTTLFLQVCDEGKGITDDQIDAIFEPLEQGDRELYREFVGSGLGLAIAKRKAETMGGSLRVSSTPGQGSNFIITLPLLVSEEVQELPVQPAELPKLPADSKILVMDDNDIDHTIMKHFLARLGVSQVWFAHDGADGIEMTRRLKPDVILMDLHMPVMSGRDTFLYLRRDEQLKHIPVVAVSSDAFKEQEVEVISMGMDGYLRKPVEPRVLHAILEKLLRYNAVHIQATLNSLTVEQPDPTL
ncbi:ATP-binding protein [Chitinophaga sp. 22620]|uniref:ATP-binding protein n=1 Tax=Chitinophaga sp. 22620 TaxID=3453952 RepID=UPI003F85E01C